jgi:hypothetical protein
MKDRMPKQRISVTLSRENLVWLRGQTRAAAGRSVSETLDRLVAQARTAGRLAFALRRSVVGTIRIAPADPALLRADMALRALFPGQPKVSRSRSAPRSHDRARPAGG